MNTLAILVASVLISCSIAAENRDRRQSYGGLSTGGGIPDYAVEYNGFNPVIPTTSGYSGGNLGNGYSGTGNGYSGTGSGYSGTGNGYSGTGNGYSSGTGNGNYGYNNGGGYRRGNNRRGNGNRNGYGNNYNPTPIIIEIEPYNNGYNSGYNGGGGSSSGNTGYGR